MKGVLVFGLNAGVIMINDLISSDIDQNAMLDDCVFGFLQDWHNEQDMSRFAQWHRAQQCDLQLATFNEMLYRPRRSISLSIGDVIGNHITCHALRK